MPTYESTGPALRILKDPSVRAQKHMCAQSVGDALGMHLGNANQWPQGLKQRGYKELGGDQIEPGDIITWDHFGTERAGFKYGHIGIAVRDEKGRVGYASNFNGRRIVRPLDPGYRVFRAPAAQPVVKFQHSGMTGRPLTARMPGSTARDQQAVAQEAVQAVQPYVAPHIENPLGTLDDAVAKILQPKPVEAQSTFDQQVADPLKQLATSVLDHSATAPISDILQAEGPALWSATKFASPLAKATSFFAGEEPGTEKFLSTTMVTQRLSAKAMRDKMIESGIWDDTRADNEVDPSLGRRIFGAAEPKTLDETYTWTNFFGENYQNMDLASMTPGERTIWKISSGISGLAADTLIDPLSWFSFGLHGLAPASMKWAMALRAGKFLEEGETVAKIAKAGVKPAEVLDTVKGFIRSAWDAELGDDLLSGGRNMARRTDELAQALVQSNGIEEGVATQLAGELMPQFRAIRRAPAQISVPFTSYGYPLPKAAEVRDRMRMAVGLTGFDFKPKYDTQFLQKRRAFAEVIRNTFDFEPLIPFGSEREAYEYDKFRTYERAYQKALPIAEKGALPADATWGAQQNYQRQQAVAEGGIDEARAQAMEGMTPDARYSQDVQAEARRAARGHMIAEKPTPANHVWVDAAKRFLYKYAGIPQDWRRRLKNFGRESGNDVSTATSQIEVFLKGVTAHEAEALAWWGHEGTTGTQARAYRLHDLLVVTGELRQQPKSAEAMRVMMRLAAETPEAQKELAKTAPRAARLIDVWDKWIRPKFDTLFDESVALGERAKTLDVELPELSHKRGYIPHRNADDLMESTREWQAGKVGTTPRAMQDYMHRQKMRPADARLLDLEKGAEPSTIMDIRLLLHMRVGENARLKDKLDAVELVRNLGVHYTDPAARDLIELLGYKPMPKEGSRQVFAAGDDALKRRDSLAQGLRNLEGPATDVVRREQQLQEAHDALTAAKQAEVSRLSQRPLEQVADVVDEEYTRAGGTTQFTPTPQELMGTTSRVTDRGVAGAGRPKTYDELLRGTTKEMDAYQVRDLKRTLRGTLEGFRRLGKNLDADAFVQMKYAIDLSATDAVGGEKLLNALGRKYGVINKKGFRDDVYEYIGEWGDDLIRGWNEVDDLGDAAHLRSENVGELAPAYADLMRRLEHNPRYVARQEAEIGAREEGRARAMAYAEAAHIQEKIAGLGEEQDEVLRTLLKDLPKEQHAATQLEVVEFYNARRQEFENRLREVLPDQKPSPLMEQGPAKVSDELLKAFDTVSMRERQLRKAELRLQRRRHAMSSYPEGLDGEQFDPELVEYLLPPNVIQHFQRVKSERHGPGVVLSLLNNALGHVRGNVLISMAFHAYNGMDNWITGRWLAGQAMIFDHLVPQGLLEKTGMAEWVGSRQKYDLLTNARSAMRELIAMTMRDLPQLSEEEAYKRIAKFEKGWLQRIFGDGMPAEELEKYAKEIRKWDLVHRGEAAVFAAGQKHRQATVGLRAMRGVDESALEKAWRIGSGQPIQDFNRRIGGLMEDIPRVATYMTARQKGYSPMEAKRLVDASFVDFGRDVMAPFDEVIRQVTLFWPYTRQRAEQTLSAMFRNPYKLVAMEAARDRWQGKRATLELPGGHDIPLSPLPDTPDSMARFSKAERYLFRHGLKDRRGKHLGFLAGDYAPLEVPMDANGNYTGPWAALLRKVMPSKEHRQLYAALDGKGNNRYHLFVRTGLSNFEIFEKFKSLAIQGDPQQIGDMAAPLVGPLVEMLAGDAKPEDRNFGGYLKRVGKQAGTQVVPLGRMWFPMVTPPRAVTKPDSASYDAYTRYKARVRLARMDNDLRKWQKGLSAVAGIRFYAVPEADLIEGLSKDEKREYQKLLSR